MSQRVDWFVTQEQRPRRTEMPKQHGEAHPATI